MDGDIHCNGLGAALDQAAVVRSLGLAGGGQALEDMGLEGPGKTAQRAHNRELASTVAAGEGGAADGGTSDDGRHYECGGDGGG